MPQERVESRFADAWTKRSKIRPAIVNDWIDNKWVKGRTQFLTFLIRINDEHLIEEIIEVQKELATIPCVDQFPKDYLHITVKGCGFPVEVETHTDDILIENLGKVVTHAEEILHAFPKFTVLLPKLNIFSEVAIIEVHDKGKIGELNKRLQAIPKIKRMKFDYPVLLPHISIVQFQNDQGFARLLSLLEELRETKFGGLTVNSIELVNAHLSGRYPTLNTVHAFALR